MQQCAQWGLLCQHSATPESMEHTWLQHVTTLPSALTPSWARWGRGLLQFGGLCPPAVQAPGSLDSGSGPLRGERRTMPEVAAEAG